MPEPAHHWRFDAKHLAGSAVKALRGPDAKILGGAKLAKGVEAGALVLDGKGQSVRITDRSGSAGLPEKAITVEAWVRVERGHQWGGIIGAVRDNGNDETGWLLGFSGRRFSFALATEDKRSLTYLKANGDFELGRWYHVAGTYDGRDHRVYVNGALEATDASRKGKILYPPTDTFYEIGAYHDTNEFYPMAGQIHEAAVYHAALSARQIAQRYAAGKDRLPKPAPKPVPYRPALGPYVRHDAWRASTVCWQTDQPAPSILLFGVDGKADRRVEDKTPKTAHRIRLRNLRPGCKYTYQIVGQIGGKEKTGPPHVFDTTFNYCPPPLPVRPDPFGRGRAAGRCAAAAERILRVSGVREGYCVVYGIGRGQLAYELARRSDLIVVGVDEDAAKVAAARALLRRADAYGPRITVRHVESLAKLPFTRYFANLVVSADALGQAGCRGSAAEVYRLLRPGGGVACFGWPAGAGGLERKALEAWLRAGGMTCSIEDGGEGLWATAGRGPLAGAGRWTHQYAGPGNSSFGGEARAAAGGTGDFEVQWIGRPGADFGLDRNPRMPAPLSAGGRLFHQGMNRIIALDAYNGTVLWLTEIPDLRRVNIPRDASNWCADENRLYLAVRDRCWVLDARTGRLQTALPLPARHAEGREWGYVGREGDKVFGTSVKAGSSYTAFWGHDAWYDRRDGPGTHKVCSDAIFAREASRTGQLAWTYACGAVINTTIAVGDGRVYFVESRHAEPIASPTGRIRSPALWSDQFLVALDASTGRRLWQRPIDPADGTIVFFLVHADRRLLIASSGAGSYHLYTYDAATGKPGWEAAHKWPSNNHGGHMQHPAVVNGAVYLEPRGYDLKTGRLLTDKMGRREGCATYAATAGALIHRGRSRRIAMWDLRTGAVSSWTNLRPSCWLSVIPAAGMILAPEGGGGCSCGNWLETSVGFLPKTPVKPAGTGGGG